MPGDGPRLVGALCAAIGLVLTLRGRVQDKLQLGRLALTAACDDDEPRAIAHDCLGSALLRCGDPEQALGHLQSACEGFERTRNSAGEAVQLAAMATAYRLLGRLPEAVAHSTRPIEALGVFARALDASGRSERTQTFLDAEIRWGIGRAHQDLGDEERAAAEHRESARILDDLGLLDTEERKRIGGPGFPEPPDIIRRNT